jgi:hypothetical protein
VTIAGAGAAKYGKKLIAADSSAFSANFRQFEGFPPSA